MLEKIVIILTICFLVNSNVLPDKGKKSIHHKVQQFAQNRCKLQGYDEKLEEIDREMEVVDMCLTKQFSHYTLSDDTKELKKTCYEDREDVIKCFKRFMDVIFPCLLPEEEYLPDFIIDSYKGYSEYLCEHIDVLTFSGLLETNLVKCLNKFMHHPEYNPQYVCYDETRFAGNTHGGVVTKEDLCADIDIIYDCYEGKFKEHCPDAPKAWEFQAGLFKGMEAPCKKMTIEDININM